MSLPPITAHSEQAEILKAGLKEIVPPSYVRMEERDMPFFRSVIAEYARADWSDHQIEIACILARAMSGIEEEQYQLTKEGSIAYSEKGTPVVNPRKVIVQMYASSILQLRKSLCLDARSAGHGTDIAKKRANRKSAEATLVSGFEDVDDGLIARPN